MLSSLLAVLILAAAPDAGAALPRRPAADGGAPAPVYVRGVVYHGPRTAPRVALTFDACSVPHDDHVDQAVLDALIQRNVPASLFLGGLWMEDQPEVVATLKANPLFQLASHSYLHPHLPKLSTAALQSEVDRSQADFVRLVGHPATLLRPPFGEVDARVTALLLKNGLTPIEYDLPSGDPDKSFTKKRLVRWVVKHAQAGSIIVMHMNGRGWHTAESLPDIIDGLRQRGFELVTVGDLIGAHPSPAPDAGQP